MFTMRVLSVAVLSTCLLAVALGAPSGNNGNGNGNDHGNGNLLGGYDHPTSDGGNGGNDGERYSRNRHPNILLIVADDLGWNDVGFNGSPDVKTPNLDALAADGVKLTNYYVQPVCTPSRVQLMSGVHEVAAGLCHEVIHTGQRNALPITLPTIADKLKESEYDTHMIGKWNLGHYQEQFTPTNRGFDTFYGYLNALTDHYSHGGYERFNPPTSPQTPPYAHTFNGHDFWINNVQSNAEDGQYTTHLYTSRVQQIIEDAADERRHANPFFIDLSFSAPHWPLTVPSQYLTQYSDPSSPSYINDDNRRHYAAMVSALDEGVGNITATLKAHKRIWENTVIIFTTDNGGVDNFGGNNFPLRGKKQTFWEGGLRGVSFVSGPRIHERFRGTTEDEFLHISDWYPTIVGLAGGDTSSQTNLYGYDVWRVINGNAHSPRDEILHGIDTFQPIGAGTSWPGSTFNTTTNAAALRQKKWKIVTGPALDGNWYNTPYVANASLPHVGPAPPNDQIIGQQQAEPGFKIRNHIGGATQNVWLFNIEADPQELNDLSATNPHKVNELLDRLAYLQANLAVPCRFPPMDLHGDPANYGGNFEPWVDASGNPPPQYF